MSFKMSLYDWCIENNREDILKEWDYTRNIKTPKEIGFRSDKMVYWLCNNGHSYQKIVLDRTTNKSICPICYKKENNLEAWSNKNNPNILKMYSNNNLIKSSDITYSSSEKVIWYCPKFKYEWEGTVNSVTSRYKKIDCVNCNKSDKVIKPNDISCGIPIKDRTVGNYISKNEVYQELEKWWVKENSINFLDIGYGDGDKKYFWKCPMGHIFQRSFEYMTSNITCPICMKHTRVSFSELLLGYELRKCYPNLKTTVNNKYFKWLDKLSIDIYIPNYKIAIELDGPRHNEKLDIDNRKDELCKQHGIKLIRVRYKGLPQTKYAHHIWLEKGNNIEVCESAKYIVNLINQHYNECKVLNIDLTADEREVSKEFYNHLRENALGEKYPELAKEFDIKKNGGLNPYYIPFSSNISYWWYCEKCDSSWEQTPNARTHKGYAHKCPYCNNDRVREGFNDIATTHSWVLIDWDYSKNDKKPTEYVAGSHAKVWWRCHNCDHKWQTIIKYRCLLGTKCPKCMKKIKVE